MRYWGISCTHNYEAKGLVRHSLAFLSCKFHSILWPSMIDDGREVGHVPSQWCEIFFERALLLEHCKGGPPLTQKTLTRSPTYTVLVLYAQMKNFCVSRGPPTVPKMYILYNVFFFEVPKSRCGNHL